MVRAATFADAGPSDVAISELLVAALAARDALTVAASTRSDENEVQQLLTRADEQSAIIQLLQSYLDDRLASDRSPPATHMSPRMVLVTALLESRRVYHMARSLVTEISASRSVAASQPATDADQSQSTPTFVPSAPSRHRTLAHALQSLRMPIIPTLASPARSPHYW